MNEELLFVRNSGIGLELMCQALFGHTKPQLLIGRQVRVVNANTTAFSTILSVSGWRHHPKSGQLDLVVQDIIMKVTFYKKEVDYLKVAELERESGKNEAGTVYSRVTDYRVDRITYDLEKEEWSAHGEITSPASSRMLHEYELAELLGKMGAPHPLQGELPSIFPKIQIVESVDVVLCV